MVSQKNDSNKLTNRTIATELSRYDWVTTCWVIIIIAACMSHKSDEPNTSFFDIIPHFDKVVHIVLYAILTLLWTEALARKRGYITVGNTIMVTLLSFSLGVCIEVFQPLVGRTSDIWDAAANAAGCVLGVIPCAKKIFKARLARHFMQ